MEGNSGTANLTFTATLSAASGRVVTVNYATVDGTATAPADYTSLTGTLTFNPGVLTRTIAVPVVGDTRDEFDETFVVALSSPTNATVADDQGVGTIVDNDALPTVSVDNVSTAEGDAGTTTATFTASLSAPSGKPISVDYATADGTASSPADYAAATGTLSFTPGQTTKTVDVTIQGDVMDEFDETYDLQLSNLVNVLPGTVVGTGTITDDDAAPTVSIADVSLPEGDAGAANASLTVSLSAVSGKPIDVSYASADGTATAPSDYTGVSGTLSFAPGQVSKTVDVVVNGDITYENDESLSVALSAPVNATLGTTPGTVTIVNDDPLPQVSIDDRSVAEGDSGTTPATFTLSLTNPSAFPISVDVATSDLTASSPVGLRRRIDRRRVRPRAGVEDGRRARRGRHHGRVRRGVLGRPREPGRGRRGRRDRRGNDRRRRRRSAGVDRRCVRDRGRRRHHGRDVHRVPLRSFRQADRRGLRQCPRHRGRSGRLHRRLRQPVVRAGADDEDRRRRRPGRRPGRVRRDVRREPVEPRQRDAGHRGRHGDDPRRRPAPDGVDR